MSANQPQQQHVHPAWFSWIQRHAALSGLLAAQWIVTTLMILMVSVGDPAGWQSWAWYDWLNFVVAILLGLAAAGIALGLSATMADSFGAGKWIKGAFGMFGVLLLVSFDIWAGVAERSRQARPTPADEWLADTTGIPIFRVVPISVVFVAFLHASLILFYGWSARPQVVETEQEREARHAKELSEKRHKAAMREVDAGGIGAAGRALKAGFTGKKDETLAESGTPVHLEVNAPSTSEKPAKFSASRVPGKKTAKQWTAADLQAYVAWAYDRVLDDITAGNMVRSLGGNQQIMSLVGKPYYANNLTAKGWADKVYSRQQSDDQGASEAAG
jgi:hypothetical protein